MFLGSKQNRTASMGKQYIDYEVYLVNVDPDKCDGCEKCIIYCPVDVFDFSDQGHPGKASELSGLSNLRSGLQIKGNHYYGNISKEWSVGALECWSTEAPAVPFLQSCVIASSPLLHHSIIPVLQWLIEVILWLMQS